MSTENTEEMLSEYKFDYKYAKANRFATSEGERTIVVLDEELSKIFTTSESVHKALKALLDAVPSNTPPSL